MSSDHQEQFAETFEGITHYINNGELNKGLEIMNSLHYADLADFLDNTNHKLYKVILPLLKDNIEAEILICLSISSKQLVIEILGIQKSAQLIDQLNVEDAIEVIIDLEDEIKQLILNNLSQKKQHQIIEGSTYPENTVGRVIERKFVCFQEHWTVKQSIDYIKSKHIQQDFHAAIVIDNQYRPVGSILVSTLLQHNGDKLIRDLMHSEFKIASTCNTDLSELSFIFKQYALTIVPVVNKSGKLVGSVSIDNMIYIIAQQTEKDIMLLGGVQTQDTFYNLLYTVKNRLPWLFVNLITACIIANIISRFNDTLTANIALVAILPIVTSMGGGAGTQVMTVTIIALANKEIYDNNIFKVLIKEILVCGFNGFIFACLAGIVVSTIMSNTFDIRIIFAIAVFLSFLVAGFFGAVIPITLHYLHIDPAIGSGIFLAAIADAFGFYILLTLASRL